MVALGFRSPREDFSCSRGRLRDRSSPRLVHTIATLVVIARSSNNAQEVCRGGIDFSPRQGDKVRVEQLVLFCCAILRNMLSHHPALGECGSRNSPQRPSYERVYGLGEKLPPVSPKNSMLCAVVSCHGDCHVCV